MKSSLFGFGPSVFLYLFGRFQLVNEFQDIG